MDHIFFSKFEDTFIFLKPVQMLVSLQHVWRFLGGRGVGGVTREVSYAVKGENKYFDLGKNKTRPWK